MNENSSSLEQVTVESLGSVPLPNNLAQWQDDFFVYLKEKGRSDNTLKNYRTDLECFNHFLNARQKNVQLNEMNAFNVEDFGVYLNERYNSDNSRRRRIQTLRLFLDFLMHKNLLTENPVRKLPSAPKFLDIPRPAPLDDVKRFWSLLKERTFELNQNGRQLSGLVAMRNQMLFLLIYGGGLKVSDIAGLSREDLFIDRERGEVRILVTPPRRDPYTVPLPTYMLNFIHSYFDTLDFFKEKAGLTFADLLFSAKPYQIISGGLSPRGIEVIFKEYSRQLKCHITPKSLRQSCIFVWLNMAHPGNLIKEWLGVAPSYSLRPYEDLKGEHVFHIDFLDDVGSTHRAPQTIQ